MTSMGDDFLLKTLPVNEQMYEKCKDNKWIDTVIDDAVDSAPTWPRLELLFHIFHFANYRREDARVNLKRHIDHFSKE